MAKSKPRTKKGKERKVAKVLREAKRGTLRTSADTKPVSRAQEVAIALSEAGVSKNKRKKRRKK